MEPEPKPDGAGFFDKDVPCKRSSWATPDADYTTNTSFAEPVKMHRLRVIPRKKYLLQIKFYIFLV